MKPRILVNLVFFAALGALLTVWALSSIITLDLLARPVTVTAEFASSPGLRKDLEVDYLGVRVGSVGDVRLRPGRVAVDLRLDRDASVPGNVTAHVLRKSAVGEPYVELTPPAARAAAPLRGGDHIPLGRTTVAVEYKQLFDGAGALLKAVNPQDARTLTRELAVGLEGRGQTLRDLMGDTHQLTGTLADNAGVLDSLAVQLTQLTGTLAASGPQLGSGLNDLAAFTAALRESGADLNGLLERGPGLVEQVNGLLADSRPGLRCLLYALGSPGPPVFTPEAADRLRHSLSMFHNEVPKVAGSVLERRPEGTYARVRVVVSMAGPVPDAEYYPKSAADPVTPPLYECTGARTDAPGPSGGPSVSSAEGAGREGPFTTLPARRAGDREARPSSPSWLPLLPVLAGALVLAVTAGRAAAGFRRYRSRP